MDDRAEARSLEEQLVEYLQRLGYWQFDIVLGGDGGYESTYRTREGYQAMMASGGVGA